MVYKKSDQPTKLEMIEFICNYREIYSNNPMDYDWIIQQPIKKIMGIYYDCLENFKTQIAKRNSVESQISFDDLFEQSLENLNKDDIPEDMTFEEYASLLAGEYEILENNNDYYDENNHLLSDIQRMERRENAKVNRGFSRVLSL